MLAGRLASVTSDPVGVVTIWDATTGQQVAEIREPTGARFRISAVAFSPNGVHLATAHDDGNVGLWEWSLVSGAVYYSTQWKRQLGYDNGEIAPDFEAWRSRIHPDDLERAISAIGEYLRGGTPDLEIVAEHDAERCLEAIRINRLVLDDQHICECRQFLPELGNIALLGEEIAARSG